MKKRYKTMDALERKATEREDTLETRRVHEYRLETARLKKEWESDPTNHDAMAEYSFDPRGVGDPLVKERHIIASGIVYQQMREGREKARSEMELQEADPQREEEQTLGVKMALMVGATVMSPVFIWAAWVLIVYFK